jgi:hypothetical protein
MNNFPGGQDHKPKFMIGLAWLCLSLLFSGCWSAKDDAAKLAEIQSVWARLPSYPGMQETGSSTTNAGGGKALVSKKYGSNAPYEEVKRFYVEYLERDGWKTEGEKQLKDWGSDFGGYEIRFRKGDLNLAIEYAGPRADYGWQYGISVTWSRWEKKAGTFF